jgi:iron complex outermembrane receptor protein
LSIAALYDQVKARIDTAAGQQDAPRIPASRYGLGLDWHIENLNFRSGPTSLDANIKFQRVDRQSDIAQFERDTDGYNDLSAYIGMTFEGLDQSTAKRADQQSLTLFLQGRNLTDAEQRNHSSFIKDFAPAPGRTLELGARYSF